jgi:hypothetical protein
MGLWERQKRGFIYPKLRTDHLVTRKNGVRLPVPTCLLFFLSPPRSVTTPSLNASSHFQHKLPGPHTLQHSRNEDDDHMDTTGMAGDSRPACLESSEVSFFFLSIFFYYTNDCLKVDYASPPIHFDTSNHQQTATTNMAPR